jgi:hypothetical protein
MIKYKKETKKIKVYKDLKKEKLKKKMMKLNRGGDDPVSKEVRDMLKKERIKRLKKKKTKKK